MAELKTYQEIPATQMAVLLHLLKSYVDEHSLHTYVEAEGDLTLILVKSPSAPVGEKGILIILPTLLVDAWYWSYSTTIPSGWEEKAPVVVTMRGEVYDTHNTITASL